MKKLLFIGFIVFQLIDKSINSCSCPANGGGITVDKPSLQFSLKEEIINDVSYGIPFKLEKLLVLPKRFNIPSSVNSIVDPCPSGYRLPNKDELMTLTNAANKEIIYTTLQTKIPELKLNSLIISSSKTFPSIIDGSKAEAWQFTALKFANNSNFTLTIQEASTYFSKENNHGICIFDSNNLIFTYNAYDYILNESYTSSVVGSNIVASKWEIEGNLLNGNKVNFKFTSNGCKTIRVWGLGPSDVTSYACTTVFVKDYFGSNGSVSGISKDDIKAVSLIDTSLEVNFVFFNRVNTAIAPRKNGGLYLLYSDISKNLKVASLDSSLKLETTFSIEAKSFPLDIVETENGFVVYAKSSETNDYSFIRAFDSNGIKLWNNILMNNGELPVQIKEQITFYDKNSKALSGINVMFSNQNGKLAYGRGRIGVIFAHYNHFGLYENGSRNDHTGDTFYSFDENGKNENYAWAWKTSHSLNQSQFYDGKYFVTASLGDVYPENITVCFITPDEYTNEVDGVRNANVNIKSVCKNIVEKGKIPGNGAGNACGRLGGITKIKDKYYLTFSRQSCSFTGYDKKTTFDNNAEIGLIEFSFVNNNIINNNLFNLGSGEKVVNLRSQKYGDKILINLVYLIGEKAGDFLESNYVPKNNYQNIMLVDTKGNIVSKIEKFTPFNVPVTEDMKELKDGKLVWGYVDNVTKVVSLAYLPAPAGDLNKYINLIETKNNDALITTSTTTVSTSSTSWIYLNMMIIAILLLII